MRWLTAERVPVLSLRERYGKLQQLPGLDAESGNLMLTTAPQLYPLRQSEVGPLRSWVEPGQYIADRRRPVRYAGLVHGRRRRSGLHGQHGSDDRTCVFSRCRSSRRRPHRQRTMPPPSKHNRLGRNRPSLPRLPSRRCANNGRRDQVRSAGAFRNETGGPASAARRCRNGRRLVRISQREVACVAGRRGRSGRSSWRTIRSRVCRCCGCCRPDNGQIILSAYGSILTNKTLGSDDNAQAARQHRALVGAWRRQIRHRRCASRPGGVLRSHQVFRRPATASHLVVAGRLVAGVRAELAAAAAGGFEMESGRHHRVRARDRRFHGTRAAAGHRRAAVVCEFFQRHAHPHGTAAQWRARLGLAECASRGAVPRCSATAGVAREGATRPSRGFVTTA